MSGSFGFITIFVIILVVVGAMFLAFRQILQNLRFERYKEYLKKHEEHKEWERKNENTLFLWKVSRNAFVVILPVLIAIVWISKSSSVFFLAFIFLIVSAIATSVLEYFYRKQVHNTIPKDWK